MGYQFVKMLSAGALAISLGLSGCSDETSSTSSNVSGDAGLQKKEIVIGTTPGDFGDMVKDSIASVLEKKGYTVKHAEFADYVMPNKALADGSIDVNVFQHKPYLDTFAADNKLDLSPIFQVPTAALGIYPGRLKNLKDIKDGSTIAVANDPSNFARALVMLDDFKWIKLKEGVNHLTVSEKDIVENYKNIKLTQMDAAQIPNARPDVDFAIINGNYATAAGIKITESLYQEPSFAYVNWGVVRTADVNEAWVKDVIEAYNSDEFKEYCAKRFVGYKNPKNWGEAGSSADMNESTSSVEAVKTNEISSTAENTMETNAP